MKKTLALFFITLQCIGLANPENLTVVSGSAHCDANGTVLTIATSDQAILHWEQFSIQKGEVTDFQLPSPQSAVLNRVVGGDISAIYGQLRSNGDVYLINPNGILIGKEGVIQTATFCASTLSLSDEDFLNRSSLHFAGDTEASLINEGKIVTSSGDLILISPKIHNSGEIEANGQVAIGAGYDVTYFPHGDERIAIKIQNLPQQEGIAIHQEGAIHALQAELKSDGNLYAFAIKNDGYIKSGKVTLQSEKGHVNHAGEIYGEEVRLLGEYVTLIDKAQVDVSSQEGGGTILIGGDYQGLNPDIMHAQLSLVEKGVELKADSLERGDGGKIIVWADHTTGFYGNASAQGGKLSGDGGFVEVSAKEVFEFAGLVNTLAPSGKAGTLLLDPTDITISNAATDAGIVFGGGCGANTYCNTGALSPRNIQIASILANLAVGNVTINSTPGGPAGGNGDITFSAGAPFTWAAGNNTFTLNARRNINFNANFTNSTASGNFVANSGLGVDGDVIIAAGVTVAHSSAGTITFNANTTAGSDVTINGILNVTNGNLSIILLDDFTLAAAPAALTFTSPGNTFTFTTTAAAGSVAAFNGPVIINGIANWNTSGTLNINDTLTTSGTGTFTITSAGMVNTAAASVVTIGSSGDFSLSTTNGADILPDGVFNITSANATFFPDDDFTLSATGSMTYSAAGKTLTFTPGPTTTFTFNGPLSVTGGNLSVTAVDDIIIGPTPGAITYNVAGGSAVFTSTGGADPDFTINGTLSVINGSLTATTFDDITLGAAGIYNYSSPDAALLSAVGPDGDIIFNGTTTITNGTTTMMAVDDITMAGTITYSSPGAWVMQTTGGTAVNDINLNGTFNISNGQVTATASGNVSFGGAANTLTYTSPLPFTVTATLGNVSFAKPVALTTAATFTITAAGDIIVTNLVRNFSTGNITATAGDDFIVGDEEITVPVIFGTAGGITRITAGDDLSVTSSEITPGATAFIGFSSGGLPGSIIITVNGEALIDPNSSNDAGIQSPTTLTMDVGEDLSLSADPLGSTTGSPQITSNGTMTITAENITISGFTNVDAFIQSTAGNMTIVAQNDITLLISASIRNLGPGRLYIVVDQQAPLPPEVGPGRFLLLSTSSAVSTAGGELGIFTATPSQNIFNGTVNGLALTDGNQVFGVWFSTFTGTSSPPFTVYYKIGGPIPPIIVVTAASAEMIQDYFNMMMGLDWMNQFFACTPYDFNIYSIYYRKPFQYPTNLPWIWSCPPLYLAPVVETF